MKYLINTAAISTNKEYRYNLFRRWNMLKDICCFVMLNPSTADALQDDPTIRRCVSFADTLGFGGLVVVNLFAYRATNPAQLGLTLDPVGPENDEWIRDALSKSRMVIAGWGANKHRLIQERKYLVTLQITKTHNLMALKLTEGGEPWHPLYLRGDLKPFVFQRAKIGEQP